MAVDTAVLSVLPDGRLAVLLANDGDDARLPGTFVHPGETLARAALRALRDKTGVDGREPRQLHVFDAPDRDPRGWVLSVAHLDAVPYRALDFDAGRAELRPVDEVRGLLYGHDEIVRMAVERLRDDYAASPDPAQLMPGTFTLRSLQNLHESVLGIDLPRDTFRRTMEPQLSTTGGIERGGVGKPARTFRTR
ncbi:NUDIX domain-containing protein [Schumannella sp. 10F1B-5-1]|uniref:NUDIX hydrolase n=1 Tax=Schumannella sp. 10F1B-5-1 TaxID=2590780 RepID=UPI0021021DF8|nr:NUDIX domain-containing protein [Schumannella sp. 10F1B-5-1]